MSDVTATAVVTQTVPAGADERVQLDADLIAAEWLQGANELKQRGLYVDFLGSDWSTPAGLDPDKWRVAREVVEQFLAGERRQAAMLGQP